MSEALGRIWPFISDDERVKVLNAELGVVAAERDALRARAERAEAEAGRLRGVIQSLLDNSSCRCQDWMLVESPCVHCRLAAALSPAPGGAEGIAPHS